MDVDSGDDFQATEQSHCCGALNFRAPCVGGGLEEEDEACPHHDDLSPSFLNLERPFSKSRDRSLGRRG